MRPATWLSHFLDSRPFPAYAGAHTGAQVATEHARKHGQDVLCRHRHCRARLVSFAVGAGR